MSRELRTGTARLRAGRTSAVWAVGAMVLLVGVNVHIFGSSTAGQTWEAALTDAVRPLSEGIWRLLRGGLAYLVIPMLLLAWVIAMVAALRMRARRTAVAQLALALCANATVQAVKYPLAPLGAAVSRDQLDLSGHVAVAASTLLAVLLIVPPSARRLAVWCAWLLLSALSIAIVLSRWHTLSQVLVPLFVCGAWAIGSYAVLGRTSTSPPGRAPRQRTGGGTGVTAAVLSVGGAMVVGFVWVSVWLDEPSELSRSGPTGVLGASLAVVAGSAAVTVGLASAVLPAGPAAAGGRTSAPAESVPAEISGKPVGFDQ